MSFGCFRNISSYASKKRVVITLWSSRPYKKNALFHNKVLNFVIMHHAHLELSLIIWKVCGIYLGQVPTHIATSPCPILTIFMCPNSAVLKDNIQSGDVQEIKDIKLKLHFEYRLNTNLLTSMGTLNLLSKKCFQFFKYR